MTATQRTRPRWVMGNGVSSRNLSGELDWHVVTASELERLGFIYGEDFKVYESWFEFRTKYLYKLAVKKLQDEGYFF